jgi:uncharacterized protein (TIGR02246 family)
MRCWRDRRDERTERPGDIAVRFQDAWNAHDMAAFGRLFHADASFVNRFGTCWRGVAEIVAGHERIHATIYSDSTLENEVADIDFISSEAAILHIWSRLNAGEAHPGGRIESTR